MQFNDVWLVVVNIIERSADGGWLSFWYRWMVYLAFGYTIVLLFMVSLRNLMPELPAREHLVANTLSWITSLSLLLIIPSLLVRLLPGFVLRLAGFASVSSLQQLSFDNIQYLVAILRHLAWQGSLGLLFVLAVSLHPATRRLIFRGNVTAGSPGLAPLPAYRSPPQVQVIDELTPLPAEIEASPALAADEITLIPAPPLPLAAWLRSLAYKGGNNQIFQLSVTETDIGRQIGHIILDADFSISSSHAVIHFEEGRFTLEDLSRHQSTWVNEIQVGKAQPAPLHDGDTVRFGESTFLFNTFVWPTVEIIEGNLAGHTLAGQAAPILIGSGNHTHITIRDDDILDVHARIELDRLNRRLLLQPENNVSANAIKVVDVEAGLLPPNDPPWPLSEHSQVTIGPCTFKLNLSGKQ